MPKADKWYKDPEDNPQNQPPGPIGPAGPENVPMPGPVGPTGPEGGLSGVQQQRAAQQWAEAHGGQWNPDMPPPTSEGESALWALPLGEMAGGLLKPVLGGAADVAKPVIGAIGRRLGIVKDIAAPVVDTPAASAVPGQLIANAAGKFTVDGVEYPTWIAARAAQKAAGIVPAVAETAAADAGSGGFTGALGAINRALNPGRVPILNSRLGKGIVGTAIGANVANALPGGDHPFPKWFPSIIADILGNQPGAAGATTPGAPGAPAGTPSAPPPFQFGNGGSGGYGNGPRVPDAPSLSPLLPPPAHRTTINPVAPVRGGKRSPAPTAHLARGGVIPEPVLGQGEFTGQRYEFGELGPEHVVPGPGRGYGRTSSGVRHYAGGGTIGADPSELIRQELNRAGASQETMSQQREPTPAPQPNEAPQPAPSPNGAVPPPPAGTPGSAMPSQPVAPLANQAQPGTPQYRQYSDIASGKAPTDPNVTPQNSFVDQHPDAQQAFLDNSDRAGDRNESKNEGPQAPGFWAYDASTGQRRYVDNTTGAAAHPVQALSQHGQLATTNQNGQVGVHPEALNALSNDMNQLMTSVSAPGVDNDVIGLFVQQGQQIQSLIRQQMDDARRNAEEQGKQIDPATQAEFGRMDEAFQLQLKQAKEDLARRGLYDSGVELEMETRLRRGLTTDQAQLTGQRLSNIQNNLYTTLDALQKELTSSASQWGLAGLQAGIQSGQFSQNQETTQYGQDLQKYIAEMQAQQQQEQNAAQNALGWGGLNNQRDIINAELQAGRYAGSGNVTSTTSNLVTDDYINQLEQAPDRESAINALNTARQFIVGRGGDIAKIQAAIDKKWPVNGFHWPWGG